MHDMYTSITYRCDEHIVLYNNSVSSLYGLSSLQADFETQYGFVSHDQAS